MAKSELYSNVTFLHGGQTARALRALADRADRGEIIGIAVCAKLSDHSHELQVSGVFKRGGPHAFYGVAQLLAALMPE